MTISALSTLDENGFNNRGKDVVKSYYNTTPTQPIHEILSLVKAIPQGITAYRNNLLHFLKSHLTRICIFLGNNTVTSSLITYLYSPWFEVRNPQNRTEILDIYAAGLQKSRFFGKAFGLGLRWVREVIELPEREELPEMYDLTLVYRERATGNAGLFIIRPLKQATQDGMSPHPTLSNTSHVTPASTTSMMKNGMGEEEEKTSLLTKSDQKSKQLALSAKVHFRSCRQAIIQHATANNFDLSKVCISSLATTIQISAFHKAALAFAIHYHTKLIVKSKGYHQYYFMATHPSIDFVAKVLGGVVVKEFCVDDVESDGCHVFESEEEKENWKLGVSRYDGNRVFKLYYVEL
jgi:hypothetical protein